jgi:membrane protein DedA with SNARE-associated domain
MKLVLATIINLAFRIIAALAYIFLGVYIGFFAEYFLGSWFGVPITLYLGILFILYGLFRCWRSYAYYQELNEDEYGQYDA